MAQPLTLQYSSVMLTTKERTTARARTFSRRGDGGSAASARVYETLLAQIIDFHRKPYEEVSEGSLADELGVSRTPVREALARLAKLNLVDIYPQRGSIIAPIRLSDLKKAQFLRESLEIGLVRRALRAPDLPQLLDALESEVQVQRALAATGDKARFSQSDQFFHRRIAQSAGLPEIWDDIADAKLHIDRIGRLHLASASTMPQVVEQHDAVALAMRNGRIEEIESALKTHLRRIFNFLKAARQSHPDYFVEEEWEDGEPAWFVD
jgi:DNA-binding GntR family transcriptional regulator